MTLTLGTNTLAISTCNNFNNSGDILAKTMEKLSTGLKINKAGDDAAGLVISNNMQTLVQGSKQAQANIQTATSFLAVAEDGMVSITEHLQRINDLLVNMANDTNDIDSRSAAVDEIIERLNEINRLASATNFNGRTMLDGSAKEIYVQFGADETKESYMDISAAFSDCKIESLGLQLPDNLNPYDITKLSAKNGADAVEIAGPLTKAILNGRTVYYTQEPSETNPNPDYYVVNTEAGNVGSIDLYKYNADTDVEAYEKNSSQAIEADSFVAESNFEPSNENCRAYMKVVQEVISNLSSKRGLLGAYENRMDSAFDAMTTRIETLEEAKGVYMDTDIAAESTAMTAQQIFQQINISILAQANTMPQMALSLLG